MIFSHIFKKISFLFSNFIYYQSIYLCFSLLFTLLKYSWFTYCVSFRCTAEWFSYVYSVESISHIQLFMTPMDCSTPGFPVHHQLLEPIQTHVHRVSDAIQSSHPLSAPSPLTFNLSQHQGPFKWSSSSHQVAKVWEFQLQHQSFQWIFRTDFLYDRLVGSPCSPRDSQESSPIPQFRSINSSLLGFLYSPTLTSIHDYWKHHHLDSTDFCWQSNVSAF